MSISIGVPKETAEGEHRVAAIPDVVSRYIKKGHSVLVERGAGEGSSISDADFESAGARIVSREEVLGADVVVRVQPPAKQEIAALRSGSTLISFLQPLDSPDVAKDLAARNVTAFSMELVPRISRAQKMDALSAMANIAGYKAVVHAAVALPKYFPLLTTAAGTVKPANVLVLGAGVAGLQAIATAKRLGARVSAYDVREAVKEQVESLGASFVELTLDMADMEDKAGYAKALDDEKARRQTELLAPVIAKQDVVVSTALIPGRKAPVLITDEALKGMKPGSVVVDLAASNGGNCSQSVPGETVVVGGVTIMAPLNLPSETAVHASELYSRTVMAMVFEMLDDEGNLAFDEENEVITGSCLCRGGQIVNERVKQLASNS
ncbi:MAG: Re/Si-specific NAD(P)(+) transhydrogenase subunit alpha [Bacteroidetes bacterium]|nr:Re/Si-specific NAD(P)(+) transhydrogenase subunit alpha [Bacteroidota bacterium]